VIPPVRTKLPPSYYVGPAFFHLGHAAGPADGHFGSLCSTLKGKAVPVRVRRKTVGSGKPLRSGSGCRLSFGGPWVSI
jgi:hypothetical protein